MPVKLYESYEDISNRINNDSKECLIKYKLSLIEREPFGTARNYKVFEINITHIMLTKDNNTELKGITKDGYGRAHFAECINPQTEYGVGIGMAIMYDIESQLAGAPVESLTFIGFKKLDDKKNEYYKGRYDTLKPGEDINTKYTNKNKEWGIRRQDWIITN